ncbi:MAG: hypothetical protein CL534_23285 [Ahrensia sp.]|nr:hypothetical protein [Ahrensia sp.]
MDWALVISRNRDILLRIVAALMALAGIGEGENPATLPRYRVNSIRRILLVAESATRRLVVIAARDLATIGFPVGVFMTGLFPDPSRRPAGKGAGQAGEVPVPAFALTDPLKRFSFGPHRKRPKSFPRISFIGGAEPRPVPDGWYCLPDDELAAGPLCRRLLSLKRALDDLDGQARRLARWQARRDKLLAPTSDTGQRLAAYEKEKRLKGAKNMPAPNKPRSPLRVGRPPGHRARQRHEVDEVLADLNWLALDAIAPPDTS